MGRALDTWREKLEFLQEQEALVSDPAQKFALEKEIDDAKAKIAALQAQTESRALIATADTSLPGQANHSPLAPVDALSSADSGGDESNEAAEQLLRRKAQTERHMSRVFLSYSLESEEHAASVRQLAEQLRSSGIQVELDQLYVDTHAQAPEGGWLRWSEARAEQATCVLIVCSAGWFATYGGQGQIEDTIGSAIEARGIHERLARPGLGNAHLGLVILDDFDEAGIPAPLNNWQVFRPLTSAEAFERMAKWIRLRIAMPGSAISGRKLVVLAECKTDMISERRNLKRFLEDQGWEVRPSLEYTEDDRLRTLEADLKEAVAFVQLLETWGRETGFDRQQGESARALDRKVFSFRDDRITDADPSLEHREFLGRKGVIQTSFEDFKQYLGAELEKLWQQQRSVPADPRRPALVRVVVRSPNRSKLWHDVFDWIDREPGIRSHLLEEAESLEKSDPTVPCHGYLIVFDGDAARAGLSPRRDLEHCSYIQLRERNRSRYLPPTGLVYWPPPSPDWSQLQEVTPELLLRIVGDTPEDILPFFNAVRAACEE